MTTILSNEEKINIINQHLNNLHYSKFNLEISIIEENAKSSSNASYVQGLNNQIEDCNKQISALDAEIATLF
jgi:hypothetical protein